MILDTTAPAEELQDKLSALEQLLLAYGRVAIGFPAALTAAFWPPYAPASCLPILFSSISPRRSSARPSRLRLSSPLMGRPMRGRILSSPCSIFRWIGCSSPKWPATMLIAATTASTPALPPSSTTPKSLGFPTVIDGACNASDRGDYRPRHACGEKELAYAHPWRSALPGRKARAAALSVWNPPAGACLATRVPTGEELTREKVDLIAPAAKVPPS